MPHGVAHQLIASHLVDGEMKPGEEIALRIDQTLTQDATGTLVMQELESRSGGVWRPSPGSIYPALSQLEDEGLVRSDESAGRRAFQLTDAGRAHIEENREAFGVPWEAVGGDVPEGLFQLRQLMMQLGMATMQVAQAGDEAQTVEARKVLEEARRALYRILAGDAGDEPASD